MTSSTFGVAVVADPNSEAHPIESCEVARRLTGQDQVVGGEGIFEVWAADFHRFRAEISQQIHRLIEALTAPDWYPSPISCRTRPTRIPRTSPR